MPINPLLQDQEKDQNNTNADNSGGVSTGNQVSSGQSATITPGAAQGGQISGGSANKGSSSGPVGSGNFTNLNQYVEANKDQAQGLGNALSQGVQKSANQGLTSLGQSQKEFNNAETAAGVDASKYDPNSVYNTVQGALQNPGNAQGAIGDFQGVATKATNLAAGSDTAPKALTDLSSYQTAANQLGTAEQNAGLTGTEAGRSTLLQQQFQRPDYTKGQNSLDQLLTQNVAGNQKQLSDLRNNLLGQYGLASQENQAIQKAADQRNQTVQGAQTAEQNIQNVLVGPATKDANGNPVTPTAAPEGVQYGLLTNLYNQLQNAPQAENALQQKNLTNAQQQLTAYLTQQYGPNPFGVPVATLVNSMITPQSALGSATAQNTIGQDSMQQLNTLNQLAGRDPNMLGSNVLSAQDANQFSSNVNENVDAGQNLINQASSKASADISSAAGQAANTTFNSYGQNMAGSQGVQNTIARVNSHMSDPEYDAQQQGLASQALEGQLAKINQQRNAYNLPPVSVSQQQMQDATNQVWNNILQDRMQRNSGNVNGNASNAQQFINYFQTSPDQHAQQWRDAVNAAAKVQATYNVIQSAQQNPLQGVAATLQNIPQVSNQQYSAPTRTFTL